MNTKYIIRIRRWLRRFSRKFQKFIVFGVKMAISIQNGTFYFEVKPMKNLVLSPGTRNFSRCLKTSKIRRIQWKFSKICFFYISNFKEKLFWNRKADKIHKKFREAEEDPELLALMMDSDDTQFLEWELSPQRYTYRQIETEYSNNTRAQYCAQ